MTSITISIQKVYTIKIEIGLNLVLYIILNLLKFRYMSNNCKVFTSKIVHWPKLLPQKYMYKSLFVLIFIWQEQKPFGWLERLEILKKVKGSRDHRNRIVPLDIRQHYGKPATSRGSKISSSSQIYDVALCGSKLGQDISHKISSVEKTENIISWIRFAHCAHVDFHS